MHSEKKIIYMKIVLKVLTSLMEINYYSAKKSPWVTPIFIDGNSQYLKKRKAKYNILIYFLMSPDTLFSVGVFFIEFRFLNKQDKSVTFIKIKKKTHTTNKYQT